MSSENGHDAVPDAWDDVGSGGGDPNTDLSKPLSALNVNAPTFVPGQNVFAPPFSMAKPEEAKNVKKETVVKEDVPPSPDETPPDEVNDKVNDSSPVEENEQPSSSSAGKQSADSNDWEKADELDDDEEEEEVIPVKKVAAAKGATKKTVEDDDASAVVERKEHINIVFIGHVDAGKSTIGGHLLYLTGMVDKRTLEKYEREAKEKNRESWYLSWALDTNSEEREKGKTVEVGRAYFETDKKHFTILDAPGHKSFVPNMIGGASQADLAILVISARRGEFETGFERGGQTREHAMLVKTAGVKHLVVLINKMDDPTVEWAEERYIECKEKLVPYLKKCGFNPKTDIFFMPCSGLTGAFLKEEVSEDICPWYRGPSLLNFLDEFAPLERDVNAPVRLPIADRYKDMGTIVLGKIESGVISKNLQLLLMPNKQTVKVTQIWSDEDDADEAWPGENVKLKLGGVEEDDVSQGFVLCSPNNLCHTSKIFDAQIVILEYKSIICAGYSCVLHIHSCSEEATITSLFCLLDKKTGKKIATKPRFIKQDQIAIARLEINGGRICLETFKDFPQMGRFTLRDEGKTIAIGKVLKLRD
ncbi:hypothetical protein SNE40_008756 [Patella caerulea]|uniref:Tr-type G domain-containing protein n=1 Tax=Patella caerulea TaxID=87958 RepID=A0AAN8PP50_PATCE